MQIHQLPASGAIADADMIPFDTGSVNKYITAGNLLKQSGIQSLPTSQDITVSVAALTIGRVYFFRINSYGAQSACGVPQNENYDGIAYCATSGNKIIEITGVSFGDKWLKRWNGTTWSDWQLVSGNLTGTVTRGAMMNTSDTIDLTAAGSTGILRIACKIATGGTYGASDYLLTTSIKPSKTSTGVMLVGSGSKIVNINSDGNVFFNNATDVTANYWMIGTIVFPIRAWGV